MSDRQLYRYRHGLREAVVFVFLRRGEVALESRRSSGDAFDDTFFPNGSVERRDPGRTRMDYLRAALLREIEEEFVGAVTPTEIDFLAEVPVPEIAVHFTAFLISQWVGELPSVTVEEGRPFGKIRWVPLAQAASVSGYPAATAIVDALVLRTGRTARTSET